jgi:putative endonuclease
LSGTRAAGERWERYAESFLRARGLKTVARNFHCRLGEIDLIMQDRDCLVFAEIRYRANDRFGSGADSVTRSKQDRIIRAARLYLQRHGARTTQPCRFDVLSLGQKAGELTVEWIQDAFTAGR